MKEREMRGKMNKKDFFDIKKHLKVKDRKNEKAYIHLFEGNRSIGKTFNTLKYLFEQYINRREQMVILYRNKVECKQTHLIFSEILKLYFPDYEPFKTVELVDKVIFSIQLKNIKTSEVYTIGFALSFFDVDKIKKYSNIFSKVHYILLDEFELENNRYLKQEFNKLQSIVFSVARGGGEVIRNIYILLLSNKCDIYNPYFLGFKVLDNFSKIENGILKLDGVVVHFLDDENIKKEFFNNKTLEAFQNSEYFNYAVNNTAFVDREQFLLNQNYLSKNKCNFICNLICNNKNFSVWLDLKEDIIIFTKLYMENSKITFTTDKIEKINSVYSKSFNGLMKKFNEYKKNNKIYYTSLECLEIIEKIFS